VPKIAHCRALGTPRHTGWHWTGLCVVLHGKVPSCLSVLLGPAPPRAMPRVAHTRIPTHLFAQRERCTVWGGPVCLCVPSGKVCVNRCESLSLRYMMIASLAREGRKEWRSEHHHPTSERGTTAPPRRHEHVIPDVGERLKEGPFQHVPLVHNVHGLVFAMQCVECANKFTATHTQAHVVCEPPPPPSLNTAPQSDT
jgi:hypothetical protein